MGGGRYGGNTSKCWECACVVSCIAENIEDLFGYMMSDESILPINILLRIGAAGIMSLWLSTDGKMFRDDGAQLGRTAMEGMQTVLIGR